MQRLRERLGPSSIPNRPSWTHRLDFPVMLCAHPSVTSLFHVAFTGCIKGGVVAYLLLLVVMVLFSFPATVLETGLGQLTSRSMLEIWDFICPCFKGFGFAVLVIWFFYCVRAALHAGTLLFYIISTFGGGKDLPWRSCSQSWNTQKCFTNGTLIDGEALAASEFLYYRVIGSSSLPYDVRARFPSGSFNFRLAGCIFVAWSFCVLVLIFGIRVLPKVLYILLGLGSVFSISVVIRLAFLPGSFIGFKYFFSPQWRFFPALSMVINSVSDVLSLFGGSLFTLASYNRFKNKHSLDCLAAHIYVLFQMLLVGAMYYLAVGSNAFMNNKQFECYAFNRLQDAFLINTAPALAVVSPAAFWNVLLFLCLFCFEMSFLLTSCEIIVTSLLDFWGSHRQTLRFTICGIVAIFGILLNSLAATPTSYALNDWFVNLSCFYFVGSLLFIFVCTYHFGANKLVTFVALMHDCFCLTKYLRFAWIVILPLFMVVGLSDYIYYGYSIFNIIPFSIWILVVILQIIVAEGSIKERLKSLFRPRWHKQIVERFDWKYSWAPLSPPNPVLPEAEHSIEEIEEAVLVL